MREARPPRRGGRIPLLAQSKHGRRLADVRSHTLVLLSDLPLNFLVSPFKFFVGGVVDRGQLIVRAFHRHDQLLILDLKLEGVAILRVLDEKDHEERNDGRPGIDYQLPSVAVVK